MSVVLSPPFTSADVPVRPEQIRLPTSAFSTSGGAVNEPVLRREIADAGLSVELRQAIVGCVNLVIFEFDGVPSNQDSSDLMAVVAAHAGAPFQPTKQRFSSAEVVQTPSESRVAALEADTGILPAGCFVLTWYAEVRVTGASSGSFGRATLESSLNDQPLEVLAETSGVDEEWRSFSGSLPVSIRDGDKIRAAIALGCPARSGAVPLPTTAELRRCSLFITREEEQ